MEVYFLSLNDLILVGSATFCSILKLSCDLIRCYTVLSDAVCLILNISYGLKGTKRQQNGQMGQNIQN